VELLSPSCRSDVLYDIVDNQTGEVYCEGLFHAQVYIALASSSISSDMIALVDNWVWDHSLAQWRGDVWIKGDRLEPVERDELITYGRGLCK